MENTIEEIKIKYSRVKGKINPYNFNIVCKMSTSYEYKSRLGTCLLSKDKNYNTYQAELFIRVSVNEFATRLYRFAIIQSLGDMFSQLTKLFKPNSIVKIAFPKRLNNAKNFLNILSSCNNANTHLGISYFLCRRT